MQRASKSALAAAMVLAVMAAPSGALAAGYPAALAVDLPATSEPATETPAPETPAPEAPAPETPAPETPAPETPAPETPAPETPVAEEPAPQEPTDEAPVKEGAPERLVEPKLTRDEAIAIAREHFTIPAELGQPNVGIQQSRDGAVWSLEWQTPGKQAQQTRISVGVDGVTGTIRSYSFWRSNPDQSLQLSFTRDEAKAKALAEYERLVPADYRANLKLQETALNVGYWGGTTYNFNWVRAAKGYPMAGYGVMIGIDARSGAMTNYHLSWQDEADLTLPEKVLSQAEAEAAYRKQVPLVLQYQRFNLRGTDEGEWRLVYRPLMGEAPRMNQSGALIDWSGRELDLSPFESSSVPASDKPYQQPAKPLIQEEALAVARAVAGESREPNTSSYSEQGEKTKRSAWDFSWVVEAAEGSPRTERRVRVDAVTGLVTEFNNWSETKPFAKDEVPPVSPEQATEKAIAFVVKYRPDLAGNLLVQPEESQRWVRENPDYKPTEYYISFQMLKNGLPVYGRGLSISVDARTGDIRNFWSPWYDEEVTEEYPAAEGVISADEAMAILLKEQGIEAAWTTFWDPETGTQSEPTLIWQPSSRLPVQAIDAKMGAPVDYEGRNLIEAQRFPEDIKGHYAEREIELLWNRGVFELQEGKFRPDEAVTADEVARWIVLARGLRPYVAYDFSRGMGAGGPAMAQAAKSDNSAYYGAALQAGIILPEDLAELTDINGPVPRQLFALWAARAMGYSRIAKMEARIEMSFADKAETGARYQNAVAILGGLGIVSGGSSGTFNPTASLTRADAAKILFAVSSN